MTNGCPKCEKLPMNDMCLKHQLEQADADVLKAMNRVEEIKQEIKKEKQNELPTNKR